MPAALGVYGVAEPGCLCVGSEGCMGCAPFSYTQRQRGTLVGRVRLWSGEMTCCVIGFTSLSLDNGKNHI